MKQSPVTLSFEPFNCPADILISARSYFVDRMVPECEVIHLPPKQVGGGEFWFTYEKGVTQHPETPKPQKGLRQGLKMLRPKPETATISDKVFLDFRLKVPQNWAHFLNDHLPIYFVAAHELGLSASETLLVLPQKTPGYIRRAAAFFGLETLCTDAPVSGDAVMLETNRWIRCRSIRAEWAHLPFVTETLDAAGIRDGISGDLPNRAFLSRRATRNLENEDAVEAFLNARGYTKIYPEDLSVADQFKLFEQAEHVVAIHGAGLAPMLYRSDASRLRGLIELFPCGHMTDNFRVMAHQVGCAWAGVRGKIKPEHVEPAYDLSKPFVEYSLQSFEVDLHALELALALHK